MEFHLQTIELLGIKPKVSRAAVAALAAAEVRMGRPLPSAVREWYSQAGACELLSRYSNDDPPVEIADFAITVRQVSGPEAATQELLVFRHENQSMCVWAVLLDGSDDPAVVVDVDARFHTWMSCGVTFSEHLHAWMWDFAKVLQVDLLLQAQNEPLSEAAIERLRQHFESGPSTLGWPGRAQYRFSRSGQRILIWANDDHADWFLAANTKDVLHALLATVREWDHLGDAFAANSTEIELLGEDD